MRDGTLFRLAEKMCLMAANQVGAVRIGWTRASLDSIIIYLNQGYASSYRQSLFERLPQPGGFRVLE